MVPVLPQRPQHRGLWLLPVAGFLLSGIASVICLQSAGPLQGTLFGSCIAAVLLAPTLVSGASRGVFWPAATTVAIAIGALAGIALALSRGQLNVRIFLNGAAVIAALVFAAAGLTLLLTRLRIAPAAAAWIVTILLLAWLSWPIWMSPWISDHKNWLPALTTPHPLLAIDAVLMRDGVKQWIEAPSLMYGPPPLTALGQDVFYVPPPNVWAMVGLHLTIAVPGFVLAWWKEPGGSKG
jgi:hypothetical protein